MWTGTVLGVDPSLTSTGLARIDVRGHYRDLGDDAVAVSTTTVTSAPQGCNPGDDCGDVDCRRCQPTLAMVRRQTRILKWLLGAADSASLVVLERPILLRHQQAGAQVDRAGLFYRFVSSLHAKRIPFADMPPQPLKKFATDNGAASKATVAAGMSDMWRRHLDPHVLRADDEFDALTLATMGAVHRARRHQLPITVLDRHMEVLAGIRWPHNDNNA